MQSNPKFNNCQLIYDKMVEYGVKRNGLWLEANDYPIDYLDSYQDEIYIYDGTIKALMELTGLSRNVITACIYTMRACGWIISYRRSSYFLIKNPEEIDFQEFRNRTSTFYDTFESQYASPHEFNAAEIGRLNKRIDVLERKVDDLYGLIRGSK